MAQLHVVTGKGGTGKTTLALGLARALGGRVLVCEVEGRGSLRAAVGAPARRPGLETEVGALPGISVLEVDPRAALAEYLEKHFRLGLAGRALDRAGLVDFATTIAPGLRDMLLLGKVYEAARRDPGYDAVVFDAPPTGRIVGFLTAADAVRDVAKLGPVHAQSERIMTYLRSAAVRIHVAATPGEMPVTEAIEAVGELRARRLPVSAILLNRTLPTPPDGLPGPDDPDAAALSGLLAAARHRNRAAREQRDRLASLGLPVCLVPDAPGNRPALADAVATALREVA